MREVGERTRRETSCALRHEYLGDVDERAAAAHDRIIVPCERDANKWGAHATLAYGSVLPARLRLGASCSPTARCFLLAYGSVLPARLRLGASCSPTARYFLLAYG
ncbi:MAG: hypothetical protein ACYCV5_04540, partial [Acidimicrobiales bacterium]